MFIACKQNINMFHCDPKHVKITNEDSIFNQVNLKKIL